MKVRKVCKLPWPFILIVVYILCTWQMELDKQGVAITGKVIGGLPASPSLSLSLLLSLYWKGDRGAPCLSLSLSLSLARVRSLSRSLALAIALSLSRWKGDRGAPCLSLSLSLSLARSRSNLLLIQNLIY